jgi:N,N'-diacetyllegionaminate synthase
MTARIELARGTSRVAIGSPARCFVIAEAGVNHNGDVALAHRLVDAAADAGVDAVKFQTFDPDLLASEAAPKAAYQVRTTGGGESQRDMLRKLALSRPAHAELKRHAEERGLCFLSSPFDESAADFLEELGVPAFKVPSGELTNLPFLAHLARKGRPLLVSTGMSTLDEVVEAMATIAAAGPAAVALFHCTSSYPAPADAVNLRAMATLRARLAVPVGYSDHTLGRAIPIAAVALGAELLEKHLTLDRALPGPDHAASIEPGELAALCADLRLVEAGLGNGDKVPHACELDTRAVARKSLLVARAVSAGAVVGAGDLRASRPGTGLSPARLSEVLGRRARRQLPAGHLLSLGDLE